MTINRVHSRVGSGSSRPRDAELLCVDLDDAFNRRGSWFGRKAWYLCNQMIYSPDRRNTLLGRNREISIDRPLRCVLFEESPENPSLREWQARMEKNLVLKEAKVYDLPVTLGEGRPASEHWQVFEFIPRPAAHLIGSPCNSQPIGSDAELCLARACYQSWHQRGHGGMEADTYASTTRSLNAPSLAPAGREEPEWVTSATWFFVGLGVVVRLVRYFVNYPIWHDEAFLAVNFWDRDYSICCRPLDYGQVAPWLFLAIERTIVTWLGYSEPVLRLFPTVCSVLSLPLFCHIAGRFLRGTPKLLAVAVFAVSFYPIRHGAEIKPYASDLLAALILLALAVEWIRSPACSRWWWTLTALVPILVAVSYPAVFVAGGVGIALAPRALTSSRRPVRLGCIAYNLVLVASFLAIYFACTMFQAEAMRDGYRKGCWADAFPPLDKSLGGATLACGRPRRNDDGVSNR